MPVIVSGLLPAGVLAGVVWLSVELLPAGLGLKPALAPAGSPLTLRETGLLKPLLGVIVTV